MSDRVESDYYAFMGFDPENARRVLTFYLQFFPAGPVLELACGHGVFLGLLRDDGVKASGVDIDEGMVQLAREAGHDVVLGDAIAHLKSLSDGSLRGIFAAHFLEHLPAPDVQTVYDEAYRVLEPGGMFVAAVPSAACLSVLGFDFWRDPTHVRFYDPLALQFFARQSGFAVVATGGNPFNHPGPPPHLHAPPGEQVYPLGESITEFVQRGTQLCADAEGREEEGGLWLELGNVLSLLDERAQAFQHDLRELRGAYENLLRQLYPANEVYVAASVPPGRQRIGSVPPLPGYVEGIA